jgi:hypothetical protein
MAGITTEKLMSKKLKIGDTTTIINISKGVDENEGEILIHDELELKIHDEETLVLVECYKQMMDLFYELSAQQDDVLEKVCRCQKLLYSKAQQQTA